MSNRGSRRDLFQVILLALPFIIYLYPAVGLLTAKSTTPVFFNLYSANLLLLNAFTVLIYGAFVFGLVASSCSIQFGTVFFLAILTLVSANNSVLNLAAFDVIAQVARIFAGLSLMALAFFAGKHERFWLSRISLGIGAILAFSAITDFGYASVSRLLPTDDAAQIYRQYRIAYDLAKVTDHDIVLVGDSHVWGSGVRTDQRFGDILEQRLDVEGRGPRVYSLGITGADVKGYIQQIEDLPTSSKVKQIVLCFYANDMPPRVNLQDTLQQVAASIGRASVSLRMVVDLFQLWVTPTAEAYAKLLLTHYVESDGTFDFRWKQLEGQFREFFQLAAVRSNKRPMIMILPMLIDFDTAAFDGPMRRVGNLAAHVGFEVVDTMPAFRTDGEKAERYRAAPNDLHLNEHGNRIVADVLFRAIADTP
jgi:GDSL-like Lipase/Acylhydrolase family